MTVLSLYCRVTVVVSCDTGVARHLHCRGRKSFSKKLKDDSGEGSPFKGTTGNFCVLNLMVSFVSLLNSVPK